MFRHVKKHTSLFLTLMLLISSVQLRVFLAQLPTASADAFPGCTSSIFPTGSALTGESLTFSVEVDNTGAADSGFSPFVEVVLPDELTYSSASFSVGGLSLNPVSPSPVTIVDNDLGDPDLGSATNPITGAVYPVDSFAVDSTYLAFRLPVGSFTPSQDPIGLTIVADMDPGLAVAALADPLRTQCGFALGEDPLDNPGADPVILSGFSDGIISATVIDVNKSVSNGSGAIDGETATGENFPLNYSVSANVANTATVTSLTLDETLPSNLQLVSVDSVDDDGGGFTITFTPSGGGLPQISNVAPFVPVGSFDPGGTLEVVYNSITGDSGDATDAEFVITAYVPDLDEFGANVLPPLTGVQDIVTNTADGSGTYNGLPVSDTSAAAVYDVQSLSIQKSANIDINAGPAGYSPGDTVGYTLNFQLSDYFSFEDIVIDDLLPDGMTYVPASASMSITEDGSTYPGIIFSEVNLAIQSNLPAGPPYDFSGPECLGCTLAIVADTVDDDDVNDPPADGLTSLVFDVSGAIDAAALAIDGDLVGGMVGPVPVGQPTTGTITFQATINESFVDAQLHDVSIDAYDSLINNVTISGELSNNPATYASEDSTQTIGIVEPTFTKEIVGFINNGGTLDLPPFSSDPLEVSPGDQVVFALEVDIPTGDLEDLEITDYLPQPFFDAAEISTLFDATVYTPVDGNNGTVPAAGDIAWGDGTSGFPGALPTPVIGTDVGENRFSIDFTDNTVFEESPSDGITIELLVTVTATSDPFADGLNLVNFSSYSVDDSNSPVSVFTTAEIEGIVTAMPGVEVYKGVVATDKGGALFDPVAVGPTTFAAPGSSPAFTAPFSSTELQSTPIESNISGVDGGDVLTMALVLDNFGSAEAYELEVTDTLPSGMSPAMGGLNLQVFDANGNDLGASTTGGLFGTIVTGGATDGLGETSIKFAGPLTYFDDDAGGSILTADGQANEGENVLVITYDVEIAQSAQPLEVYENLGYLSKYTATPGGATFVNEATKFQETATATLSDLSFSKNVKNATVGDQVHTTLPDVTIGEVFTYSIPVTLPEGTTENLVLTDNIPAGLGYYDDNDVTIDTTAACSGVAFDGTVPGLSLAPDVGGVSGSGTDLTVTFSGDIVVNNDLPDDLTDNTFCIEYDVVVLDEGINDGLGGGIYSPDNSATLTYGLADSSGPQTVSVDIAEPRLRVNKSAAPITGDAGDSFVFSMVIDHHPQSNTDAFDLELTDTVPADLMVVGDFNTDGLDNDGDGLIDAADVDELLGGLAPFYDGTDTFTFNNSTTNHTDFSQLPDDGSSVTVQFNVTVNDDVEPSQVMTNTGAIAYDTIPGTPVAPLLERSDSRNGNGSFTVNSIGATKSILSTSEIHTGSGEHTAADDVAIGETITYRIALDVPESEFTNLVITDTVPDVFRIDTATLIQDDTGAAAPVIAINDFQNADGVDDTASFTFASITNNPDADTEQIILEVVATVIDDAANQNQDLKTNEVSVTHDNIVNGPVTAGVAVDVVEPLLDVVKVASDPTPDAGDTVTYTITVDHNASSTADAFDVVITDIIDGNLTYASNVQTLQGPAPTVNDAGDPTITFSYDSITQGSTYEFSFDVTVNNGVSPGQVIPNQASAQYDSLPADGDPDERTDTRNGSVNIVVDALAPGKTVHATGFTETGMAQFNGVNQDLAIGETVTYRIAVDVPESTFTDFVITDTMPDRFEVTGGSLIQDDGVIHSNPPNITLSDVLHADGINDTIEFDFGNVVNTPDVDTETIIVEVNAVVKNDINNVAGSPYINTASIDYTENLGPPQTSTADVDVIEPSVDIVKTVSPLTGDAGDTFVYTITVTNNGTAPAFDLEVIDPVSNDMTVNTNFNADGYDNDGDGADGEAGSAYYNGGLNQFTWNNANTGLAIYNQLDPGVSFTLEYEVTLNNTVNPGDVITEQADLTYDSAPGVVVEERDYVDDDDASVTVDLGGISKTLQDADITKTIGDTIPYRITVTVPEAVTAPLLVADTLDAGLAYVPGTESVSTNNPGDVTWTGTPEVVGQAPASTAYSNGNQVLTFDFGDLTNANNNNGSAETVIIEYEAVVINSADTNDTDLKNNSAEADFGGQGTVGPVFAPNITVVEPILTLPTFTTSYVSGDTVTYTVRLENNATDVSGAAHDVNVEVEIPAGMTYVSASEALINGPAIPTVNEVGNPTIVFSFDEIDATYDNGNPVLFTFQATIDLATNSGAVLNTTADLTYTGQDGAFADVVAGNVLTGERTGNPADPGGAVNDYNDSDNLNVTVTRPHLGTSDKSVVDLNGGDIKSGDILEYTIDVINTGNLDATGIRVTDNIANDVNTFSIISTPVGSIDSSLPAPDGANGNGFLDVINLSVAAGNTESIVYQTTIDLGLPAGTSIDNSMVVLPPPEGGPGGFDTESVVVSSPNLTIEKTASQASILINSPVTYSIVVTNNGNSASDNATIVDTIPLGMNYVVDSITLDAVVKTDLSDLDEADYNDSNPDAVTVVIPSIAPAASHTITFVVQSNALGDILNTASVTDDQGSNESDDANVFVKPIVNGGGGGFNPPPPENEDDDDTPAPLKEVAEEEPEIPIIVLEPEACLKYDPNRSLRFVDVGLNARSRNEAEVLKGTYLSDVGYEAQRQYVMSGYASETNDVGDYFAGLDNVVTRLEWAKMLMTSHCLEIFNATDLPDSDMFGDPMPRFIDYPLIDQNDPIEDWETDVMYSAAYYNILDGTQQVNVEPRRPILVEEAIKMMTRTGEFVKGQEFDGDDSFVAPGISRQEWYYSFYSKAGNEGSLPIYLNNSNRVGSQLIRHEAVDLLVYTILLREMYQDESDVTAVNAKLRE